MGGEAVTEQEKIENCYREMYDGMVRKDGRLLSEVLDDSFVLIHMTGMRQSKEVFIRSVEDGTLNYYSTAHQEIKTEIHGETATLHGKSIVNAAVFGGGRHIWRLYIRMRLAHRENAWRITEAAVSTF